MRLSKIALFPEYELKKTALVAAEDRACDIRVRYDSLRTILINNVQYLI